MPFNRFRPLIIVIRLRGMMDRAEKTDDSSRGDKLFARCFIRFPPKDERGPDEDFQPTDSRTEDA